jgi:hypothetical protein
MTTAANRHSLKDIKGTTDIATIDGIGEVPRRNVSRNTQVWLDVRGRNFGASAEHGFEHFEKRWQTTDVAAEVINKCTTSGWIQLERRT